MGKFRLLGVFSKDAADSPDLAYMGEVEAAYLRRGNVWAYRLCSLLVIGFAAFLIWSMVATRHEVTRGTGQIIPSMGVQPVQSSHGGRINTVYVKENQEVAAGELLVKMSNIDAEVEYNKLQLQKVECDLSLKRLAAEAAGVDLLYSGEENVLYPDVVQDQMRLFHTRREKFEGGGRELQATLEEKQKAVAEALARKKQYEDNLVLLMDQEARVRPLVARGAYSSVDHLNLKHRIVTQEGELKSLAETIARTQTQVEEAQSQLKSRKAEWDRTVAGEQDEYRKQLASITQKLAAGKQQVEDSVLTAPFAGVVKRILLKESNVAQAAQVIMELLPTEDTLEVDARFRPQDRGFLEEDMDAAIKVDAYDFTIYGSLPAKVVKISPDTIEDNKGQAWYQVRLRTFSNKLAHDGQELDTKAGMTVTVDVISGEKTVYDYLLKPILKSRLKGNVRGHADNATQPAPAETRPEAKGAVNGRI